MKVLQIDNLVAGYGRIRVLHGVSMAVEEGSVAVLLGANGAGKTTTLRAISGLIRCEGSVKLDDRELRGQAADNVARLGVAHAAEGRGTFTDLTVEENLRVGAFRRADRDGIVQDLEKMYELFPRLRERRSQKAGSLSGGEQQMLAVGRALMLNPRVMLLDEPLEGLAPIIVDELLAALNRIIRDEGLSAILVEQNAQKILGVTDRAVILERGAIVHAGDSATLKADRTILEAYLGVTDAHPRRGAKARH